MQSYKGEDRALFLLSFLPTGKIASEMGDALNVGMDEG